MTLTKENLIEFAKQANFMVPKNTDVTKSFILNKILISMIEVFENEIRRVGDTLTVATGKAAIAVFDNYKDDVQSKLSEFFLIVPTLGDVKEKHAGKDRRKTISHIVNNHIGHLLISDAARDSVINGIIDRLMGSNENEARINFAAIAFIHSNVIEELSGVFSEYDDLDLLSKYIIGMCVCGHQVDYHIVAEKISDTVFSDIVDNYFTLRIKEVTNQLVSVALGLHSHATIHAHGSECAQNCDITFGKVLLSLASMDIMTKCVAKDTISALLSVFTSNKHTVTAYQNTVKLLAEYPINLFGVVRYSDLLSSRDLAVLGMRVFLQLRLKNSTAAKELIESHLEHHYSAVMYSE